MRYRPFLAILLALCLSFVALSSKVFAQQKAPLTYDQIHSTGQAAVCPDVSDSGRGKIDVPSGKSVKLADICFQPVRVEVEEEKRNGEKEFIPTKTILLPGATLGPMKAVVTSMDGGLELKVTDGIATQPTTVQIPRRERVPFLFSVKQLKAIAKGAESAITASSDFEGSFSVPGYHTSQFLDPKGRGSGTGYEAAVGLQAAQDAFEANEKTDEISTGTLSLRIARVDAKTGEIAGSFVSLQPSSTEQGAFESKLVRVQGLFYGRLES